MARLHGWLYTYEDAMDPRGEGPSQVAYDTVEEAWRAAGEAAEYLAKTDLRDIKWPEDAPGPTMLREIVEAARRGDWRAAFEGWQEYHGEYSHDISISVEPI